MYNFEVLVHYVIFVLKYKSVLRNIYLTSLVAVPDFRHRYYDFLEIELPNSI